MTQRQRYFAYLMGGYGLSLNALTAFLVPLRAVDLGVPLAVIGLLVGVRSIAETLLSVPLGRWMDRVGARTGFLAGSLGTAVLGVGFFFAEDVAVLFLLQLFIGATRPLGWVGGQSYVSGMSSGADRVRDTGRLSFVANLFQIVTPAARRTCRGGALSAVRVPADVRARTCSSCWSASRSRGTRDAVLPTRSRRRGRAAGTPPHAL